ncbi:MAG: cation transporter [Chloroflexi bacterium]|nr:cation transporter [Chloroflexota bacterium]
MALNVPAQEFVPAGIGDTTIPAGISDEEFKQIIADGLLRLDTGLGPGATQIDFDAVFGGPGLGGNILQEEGNIRRDAFSESIATSFADFPGELFNPLSDDAIIQLILDERQGPAATQISTAGARGNLNIRGAYWHIVQTFVGSIIIIVSAVVIRVTGFLEIDPLLGMGFGIVLIFASWQIIKEAVLVLLETTPPGVDLESIRHEFVALDGVEDVHHTHAWMITSGTNVFSTHVRVRDYSRAQGILHAGQKILDDTGKFHFATMQLETECTESPDAADIDIGRETADARSGGPRQGHSRPDLLEPGGAHRDHHAG